MSGIVARRARSCRSSSRCGRSRTGRRARCAPNGLSGVTVARSSAFSVSGSSAISVEPADVEARRASRGRTASARAGRRAARGSSRRRARAARPRAARSGSVIPVLDGLLRGRARGGSRAAARAPRRGARAGSPCARGSGSPSPSAGGKPRSSSTAAIGSETFIVSGRSHSAATASRSSRARATFAPATPRSSASSRIRSARGSTGLCTGWPKPGTRAARGADLARRSPPGRGREASSRAHSSAVPSTTGPAPRIPAATAPWSEPGSAASVIRAATFVGISPCSAIATSSRSRK